MGRELARLGPELRDIGVPMIIAGGYGLFLKQDRVVRTGAQTLREVPAQRTTQDIDLLLTADVVVDAGRMKAPRQVLDRLGFTVKPGCEYFQFEREVEIAAGLTRKVSRARACGIMAAVYGRLRRKATSPAGSAHPPA